MDALFKALQAYAADRIDLPKLRSVLEQMLTGSPQDLRRAAGALKEAHQKGTLTDLDYRQLRRVCQAYSLRSNRDRGAAKNGDGGAEATRLRRPTAARTDATPRSEDTQPRDRAKQATSGATAAGRQNTDQRFEDPHTWTVAGEEPLVEGRILGRHYQLQRKIGEGGMGIVYLAKDLVEADFSETPFLAIKVLKPDFRKHPDALKTLHEEVRKSRALSHPNIVSVYTFDRDATVVFMTMEYLEGKPLNDLIDEDFARGIPMAQAWPIMEGAGRALAYAHDRGVVHSDFKPSNVFVTTGGRTKVLDFGIARAMRRGRGRGFDAGALGALTEAYASCEMLEGVDADARDDVYAYACVIYELLSGRHVFDGKSAKQAQEAGMKMQPLPMLTKSQNRALATALSFDRAQRTPSIEGVIDGLRSHSWRIRSGALVAGVVVAGIAGGAWWAYPKYIGLEEDRAFVTSLLKPNAEAADVDPEQITLLMDQGNDYLKEARKDFDPAKLSDGVSTAYGAFRAVLRLDPANRPAAEKILEIVKMYEAHARELTDQSQFKRAAVVIGYGLRIDPNNSRLRGLEREVKPKAAAETANAP